MPVTIIRERSVEPTPTPNAFRNYGVSPDAARMGRAFNLLPNEIAGLARRAARFRDPIANWRYKDFAFLVANDTVLGVWERGKTVQLAAPPGFGTVTGDCPVCDGDTSSYCCECNGRGIITRTESEWDILLAQLNIV